MKPILKKVLATTIAMTLAAVIWLPCVHLFFQQPASEFHSRTGISRKARQLAVRHLELWTDEKLRQGELNRMRASNAEWDFMGRSFLVWALANMSLRDPDTKTTHLEVMDRIIAETLRLEKERGMYVFLMPYARADGYVVQPPRSLFIDGEIALMLCARRLVEEREEYKILLAERAGAITDGFRASPCLALESYPNECWTFDHCIALAALRLADKLDGGDHSALIRDWIAMAKQKLIHPQTGLLASSFTTNARPLDGPEGSSIWVVAHFLQALDPEFARDQYERARKELGATTLGFSYAHEWPRSWDGPADIDSGPIIPVLNISAGSSGLAFIAASAFGDDEFLSQLSATLDFAAFPSRRNGGLKYCASNQVGDAAMLYAATLGPIWERLENGRKE